MDSQLDSLSDSVLTLIRSEQQPKEFQTKMRQVHEAQEDFEFKAEETEVVKTVNIAIHDFTKRIDDQENKKKKFPSPEFKVGDTSFTVQVYPQDWREDSQEYIAVYLSNEGKEKVIATYTFKHASGVEKTLENRVFEAGKGFGSAEFLSHKAYKEWAKDQEDVFRVEVKINLRVEKWTSSR